MRITTNMSYQSSTKAILKASERLDTANTQMTTGNKFATAGEDPNGMSQKMALTDKISAYTQYATNGGLLDSSLSLEGTTLDSMTSTLQSAKTLLISASSVSMTDDDKATIAKQLKEIQSQLVDLMNTKNSEGEYIFSGGNSSQAAVEYDETNGYVINTNTSNKQVQVSDNKTIADGDSAYSIFEQVQTRRSASADTSGINIETNSQSDFDSFYSQYYDRSSSASNTFSVSFTGSPASGYTVTYPDGTTTETGSYSDGDTISFHGLNLTFDSPASTTQQFTLQQPTDNILNSLSQAIDMLSDSGSYSTSELSEMNLSVQGHLTNTLASIDKTNGSVGARQNSLESILSANTTLNSLATTAKAGVSEIDLYTAASNVSQQETALSVAQQAFTSMKQSTLFDYI